MQRIALVLAALAAAPLAAGSQGPKPTLPAAGSKASPPPARPGPPPPLHGTVKGPDGKPVAEAQVMARPIAPAFPPGPTDAPLTARTDPAGAFRLALRTRGPHTVSVVAKGLAGLTVERAMPGKPLALVLQKGRANQGRVRDAQTGLPIRNARVRALDLRAIQLPWHPDAAVVQGLSDAQGRYRLEGLGAGPFTVSASAQAYGRVSRLSVAPGAQADFLLAAGVSLSGTVADRAGQPVAGAVVLIQPDTGSAQSLGALSERTDAQGRFEALGLEPGAHQVVTRHPDFAPHVSMVRIEGGIDAQVSVTLDGGASVVGRLLGAGDRPVRGQVGVEESDGQSVPAAVRELLRAEAGEDGRFRIERVPPGSHALLAAGLGHAPKRIDAAVGASAVVDLGDVELEAGLAIRGRVTDKRGRPVADARLHASPFRMGMKRQATTLSDPDGSFVLGGLDPGMHEVRVQATGHGEADRQVEAGSEGVTFVLEASGSIVGAVADDAGRPVEVFSVVARVVDEERHAAAVKTVSSPEGRFLLEDLAAGTYTLQVSAASRMPASVSDLNVTAGATTDAGRIRLGAGGAIRGVVVDSQGAGIAGAVIVVRGPGRDFHLYFDPASQVISDLGGGFEVKGVSPGTVRVIATHAAFAPARSEPLDVDPARGPAEVRLVLGQGGRLEGAVRRRDGTGLAGAPVGVLPFHREGWSSFDQWSAAAAADGSFAIDHVPPGRATVAVLAGAGELFTTTQSKEVDVREAETTTVELVAREILVSGRVTRLGAPAAGITLTFHPATSMGMTIRMPSELPPAPGPQRLIAVTRDDGSYELLVDSPGAHSVWAQTRDGRARWPARRAEVPDADSFELDLSYGGVPVTGVIVDRDSEQPIAGAHVRASSPQPRSGTAGTALAGADGRFQLDLEPGEYRLDSRAEGYGGATASVTIGEAGASEVRLELGRGLTLTGRVVDGRGRGAGSLSVRASAGQGPDASHGWSETLPDGSFRMGGLEAVPHTVAVGGELSGFAVQEGVTPGDQPVVLTLRPGGRVHVVVRDASGAPVPDAWAYVSVVRGHALEGDRTDAMGIADFAAPAGELEVSARKDRAVGRVTLNVTAGEVSSGEIRLAEKPREESR